MRKSFFVHSITVFEDKVSIQNTNLRLIQFIPSNLASTKSLFSIQNDMSECPLVKFK